MLQSKLRKEFLDDLPVAVKSKVRGIDLNLINKAIAAVLNGQTTINDTPPTTREDRFTVIVAYFKSVSTLQNISMDSILETDESKTVAIKLNEQPAVKKTWKPRKKSKQISHF